MTMTMFCTQIHFYSNDIHTSPLQGDWTISSPYLCLPSTILLANSIYKTNPRAAYYNQHRPEKIKSPLNCLHPAVEELTFYFCSWQLKRRVILMVWGQRDLNLPTEEKKKIHTTASTTCQSTVILENSATWLGQICTDTTFTGKS